MPSREEQAAALVWARLKPGGRRPKPSLSHEEVARAAIETADADGIDALSMRKVAARLRAGTMTLYWYVATRDELIDLMADATLAEEPLPACIAGDWRANLTAMALWDQRLYRRHPWLVHCVLARPAHGPRALRATDHFLSGVDGLGLTARQMLDLVLTVRSFVNGIAAIDLAEPEAQRRSGLTAAQWHEQTEPYLRQTLDAGRHPHLQRLTETPDQPGQDVAFERRLSYILDGLATLAERRPA